VPFGVPQVWGFYTSFYLPLGSSSLCNKTISIVKYRYDTLSGRYEQKQVEVGVAGYICSQLFCPLVFSLISTDEIKGLPHPFLVRF